MLLIGTGQGLQDLDSGEQLIHGMAVTALAPGTDGWYALLDRRFVVLFDECVGDAVPAGELSEPDGQSLAVLPDATVVAGGTGARLTTIGLHGGVGERHASGAEPGRDD